MRINRVEPVPRLPRLMDENYMYTINRSLELHLQYNKYWRRVRLVIFELGYLVIYFEQTWQTKQISALFHKCFT